MGRPKLSLPFGPELMLQRVVRILAQVVEPVVVVAAPKQELPPLPADVIIARDERGGLGPLAGLLAGLRALPPRVCAAYAAPCDAPLLKPEFVRRMIESRRDHLLVMPRDGEHHHPLAAVYTVELIDEIERLIAGERLRPVFLLDNPQARVIEIEELRDVDPQLDSLRNTNTPAEYQAALRDAGFAAPPRDRAIGPFDVSPSLEKEIP